MEVVLNTRSTAPTVKLSFRPRVERRLGVIRECNCFQGPTRDVFVSSSEVVIRWSSSRRRLARWCTRDIRALASVSEGTVSVAMTVVIPSLESSV